MSATYIETSKRITQPELDSLCHGVILVVTAIPSTGEDGQPRIGGIGESKVAEILAACLETPMVSAGEIMRQKSSQEGEGRFEEWGAKRGTEDDYEVDRLVSTRVKENLDHLSNIVVVNAKVWGQLPKPDIEATTIIIGVNTDDKVANERMLARGISRGELTQPINQEEHNETINAIKSRRAQRFIKDQEKYASAYPDLPDYNPENIRSASHFIFDNSETLTSKELEERIRELIKEICYASPILAKLILEETTNSTDVYFNNNIPHNINNPQPALIAA